jgi:hypothetical protein
MAKAQTKPTPVTRAWARDICPVILEICGSPQYCGPWLVKEIATRRVRWWCKATCPPYEPLDDFWQGAPPSIDFENNTATKLVVHPTEATLVSITLLGLQIARADIERLIAPAELAEPPSAQSIDVPEPIGAKSWIASKARNLKKEDKIPPGIKITDFAKLLEKEMQTAARRNSSIKTVGWPHIKNHLAEWGLWPISDIEI